MNEFISEQFSYPEGKTNYQIINEDNEKTTITLEKWVADILQIVLPNVHESIQRAYNKTLKESPELTRRERGNLLRAMSEKTANQHQEIKKQIIGWNDLDILRLFE
jgi:hypothetical protein